MTIGLGIPRPPATVVRVLDARTVVINKGSHDGVKLGDRFLVYSIDPHVMRDPNTGQELGHLEIVKGNARAIHVQDRMTTLRGSTGMTYSALQVISGGEPVFTPADFESAKVGDLARPA